MIITMLSLDETLTINAGSTKRKIFLYPNNQSFSTSPLLDTSQAITDNEQDKNNVRKTEY